MSSASSPPTRALSFPYGRNSLVRSYKSGRQAARRPPNIEPPISSEIRPESTRIFSDWSKPVTRQAEMCIARSIALRSLTHAVCDCLRFKYHCARYLESNQRVFSSIQDCVNRHRQRLRITFPSVSDHSGSVPSGLPETSFRSPGTKAILRIAPAWPFSSVCGDDKLRSR